jgi:integrase/recombinase XerD
MRAFVLDKGSKEQFVPYSPRTGQAIWRYLAARPDHQPDDPLFSTPDGIHHLNRSGIQQMLTRLATRAGVENVHPHRLRHIFAVSYLRAGGNLFTLQMILGQEELEMVRHYARLANTDVSRAHRRASPVDILRL